MIKVPREVRKVLQKDPESTGVTCNKINIFIVCHSDLGMQRNHYIQNLIIWSFPPLIVAPKHTLNIINSNLKLNDTTKSESGNHRIFRFA